MIQITKNDGAMMILLFKTIGFGFSKVEQDDETSITISFKFLKFNTFLSFAWI
jgi:hypothetical protein